MCKSFFSEIVLSDFLDKVWQKKSVIYKNLLKDLNFRLKDFCNILEFSDIEFPDLVCLNQRGQVPSHEYVNITPKLISPKIIPKKVYNILNQSNTIRIRNIDKYNAEINNLKLNIESLFATKITVNGYLSKSKSQGVNVHYDTHDIFIIQLEGEKKWKLGDISTINPCRNYRPDMYKQKFHVNTQLIIEQNDILYLPRGMWHQTLTEKLSLHLSIGIHSPNLIDIIPNLAEFLLNTSKVFREPIVPKLNKNKVVFKLDSSKYEVIISEISRALKKFI